jgi:hypothetical protein
METTMESSFSNVRNKLALIEFIELSSLGFAFWCLGAISMIATKAGFAEVIIFLIGLEGIILGSWAIYNVYIRVARASGKFMDVLIWIIAAGLTGSYTFWAWSILDINRLIVSKLLYRGDAPVELAWSARSKQVRKAWEKEAQKADNFWSTE